MLDLAAVVAPLTFALSALQNPVTLASSCANGAYCTLQTPSAISITSQGTQQSIYLTADYRCKVYIYDPVTGKPHHLDATCDGVKK